MGGNAWTGVDGAGEDRRDSRAAMGSRRTSNGVRAVSTDRQVDLVQNGFDGVLRPRPFVVFANGSPYCNGMFDRAAWVTGILAGHGL